MFEKASRMKLRFETKKGYVAVEDLWDLPLTSNGVCLDSIAKSLNKELKEVEEESFVVKKTNKNLTVELKFDIIKHIIGVRLAENEKKKELALNKTKRDRIVSIIAQKEDESLMSADVDDLKKMLEELK